MSSAPAHSADPDWPVDAVEVGRILDAYGVKGWVKVQPHSSDPQALLNSRHWFLKTSPDFPARRTGAAVSAAGHSVSGKAGKAGQGAVTATMPASLHVTSSRDHGGIVIAHAREITSRDEAEALRGMSVFVSRSSFPAADEDEYYWVDLIGLEVVNLQGESLGSVVGLIDTGPHSVLQVAPATLAPGQKPEEAERLIPFVGAYVQDVSVAERRITVDWGLDWGSES